MKARCIDPNGYEGQLTLDKVYSVERCSDPFDADVYGYRVVHDDGVSRWNHSYRFEEVVAPQVVTFFTVASNGKYLRDFYDPYIYGTNGRHREPGFINSGEIIFAPGLSGALLAETREELREWPDEFIVEVKMSEENHV